MGGRTRGGLSDQRKRGGFPALERESGSAGNGHRAAVLRGPASDGAVGPAPLHSIGPLALPFSEPPLCQSLHTVVPLTLTAPCKVSIITPLHGGGN